MSVVIGVLIFIVCLLLIGIVLVQNSKGGGLSSQFSTGNQVMGVRQTADFLEKATWGLAIGLFVLCLASAAVMDRPTVAGAPAQSELQDLIDNEVPAAPVGTQPAAPVE